jgi:hypothetical protein
MNTRLIVAALLGSVVSFFLGWLVYGILLAPYYEANEVHYHGLQRLHGDMRLYGIYLSQLSTSFLLAFIFQQWARIHTFGKGFVGGMIFGFFTAVSINLYMWSSMNLFQWEVYAVDAVVNALFLGIVGGVIATILGWKKGTAA